MGFRDRCAVSVAPFFLRVALGLTFIWAGSAKIFDEKPVRGADAAALANLGVIAAPPKAAPAVTPTPTPAPVTPPAPASAPEKPAGGPPALLQVAPQAAPSGVYTAEDFPTDINVRAVHKSLTLRLLSAANPSDGQMPLWPARLAQGRWPVYAAWAAALTELVGGCWLLLGLFTRLAAMGVAGVMVGAMWLTQFGPAMQTGQTYLGFIPRHPVFAADSCGMPVYAMLLWQLALLGGALSLLFSGSGALAIDRALFGGGSPSKPAE
ncbi:MAG: DoxX family protein [Phycisphaerales bacterium]|nr:DoxX family protein [Phycisphaerales bacterium]